MHFAAVQYDIAWEDKTSNHRVIERMLDEAAVPNGAFVLLPELGDTGFSFNLDVIVDDQTLTWATKQAAQRGIWIQAGYAVRGPDGKGRNCASIIDPHGNVVATYQKMHPFSYGREVEHFSGGDRVVVTQCGEFRIAPVICYDLRFPELWRVATVQGAELFTIGASWPAARQLHWRALLIARAIENQAYVVAVNRVGRDPHLAYAGGSMIISPHGEVIAEGGDGPTVLEANLDVDAVRAWRAEFPALKDIRADLLRGR